MTLVTNNHSIKIARWYDNLESAVSLRFDDNLDSHVKYVVPVLNRFNFKATFMVNPGRNNWIINYNKYKNFWENELPKMGHRLGNHTWHHKGAETLEQAEFEIAEVSKLLWKLYPDESKLNVFASGGGEKWGGLKWRKTTSEFKKIPKKYFLIDLYDDKHDRVYLNSEIDVANYESLIENSIQLKAHLPLVFHKIGSKSILDLSKQLITGYNNCLSKSQFLTLIEILKLKREHIWIAPLIQILKYQTEYESARLELGPLNQKTTTYNLFIDTDPILYDQPLTLIINENKEVNSFRVFQDESELKTSKMSGKDYLFEIIPKKSKIVVKFK
jgi:hypothetical protein